MEIVQEERHSIHELLNRFNKGQAPTIVRRPIIHRQRPPDASPILEEEDTGMARVGSAAPNLGR